MKQDKGVEEVLEFVWSQRERGSNSIRELLAIEEVAEEADIETLRRMAGNNLIRMDGDAVVLSSDGEKLAEAAIRRHRLAERLLTEVLSMDAESIEKNACSFEHTLSHEVTDSICTLLGHPPMCPHGLPIPKGDCCRKTGGELKPILQQLSALDVGETGRIAFIVSNVHSRLDKLGTLGIVPGSSVRVHQKRPAFVIQIGETTLALDPEIIKEIYVKRIF
ncbi:MAG: metal-dependent transcriptional regulator [Deltaproteobacteria bacterium]|nr:metal-dependent transcriptional regulator [Deltaproteobacteria bacterium]